MMDKFTAFTETDNPKRIPTVSAPSISTWMFSLCILSGILVFNACAIRTSEAEHYFGPVLYTTGSHATVQSMSEQIHFPFLVEFGTQWGLSVGIIRRIRAAPLILTQTGTQSPSNQLEHLTTSWGNKQLSSNTFLSLFYLRATPNQSSEFLVRSIEGVTLGIGSEQNALTAGIKHVTEFRPLTPGIHYLCYQSSAPERMTYVVSEHPEPLSPFDCGRTSPL